jgi:hypothetical protein
LFLKSNAYTKPLDIGLFGPPITDIVFLCYKYFSLVDLVIVVDV